MTFVEKLNKAVNKQDSLLSVGLDPFLAQMPKAYQSVDKIFDFNKAIVDATAEYAAVFKPNSAHYEAYGADGIAQLKKTCDYITKNYSTHGLILDFKRADIGATNEGYTKYAFEYMGADAVTLHPYMGKEALAPFLELKNKGFFILCRTSVEGAAELQDPEVDGLPYYQYLAKKIASGWNDNGNCGLVAAATYPNQLAQLRQIVGDDMWFLVPGIGAQGGDLEHSVKEGQNSSGRGLVIHSSRGIIYASNGEDFASAAANAAKKLRDEINTYRKS